MIKMTRWVGVLVMVVAWGVALEAAQLLRVQKLTIEGLTHVRLRDLPPVYSFAAKVGQVASREDVVDDVNRLYLSGYFDDVSSRVVPVKNGIEVSYVVKENPKVTGVRFVGNQDIPSRRLQNLVKDRVGKVLNLSALDKDLKRMRRSLKDEGYILFEVDDVRLGDDGVLEFQVYEGRVEEIEFIGLNKIQSFVLRREMRQKKGQALNIKQLRRDRDRFVQMGYFSTVSAPEVKELKDEAVKVQFRFLERRTNIADVGIEVDDGEFGAFLQGKMDHALMHSDLLSVKTQFAVDERSLRLRRYGLRYVQPWFLNQYGFSFIFDAWTEFRSEVLNETDRVLVDNKRVGWDVILGFPIIWDELTLSTKYKQEYVDTDTDSVGLFDPYQIRSVSGILSYNPIENWQNPTYGGYWDFEVERAGSLFGLKLGGIDFTKYSFNAAQFFTISEGNVLAVHGFVGYFFLNSDVNIFETEGFFLGGGTSVRGYKERAFFGSREVLFNIEYRRMMLEWLQGVVFFDAGAVFDSGFETNWNNYVKGYGTGVRVFTPIGPVRFDLSVHPAIILYFNLGQTF